MELLATGKLFAVAKGSYFWRDKTVRALLGSVALFWIAILVLAIATLRASQEFVALHYTVFFGVDLVGERWNILVFPAAGLVIAGVNTFLAWLCYKPVRFASHLLVWGTFLAHATLLFSLILIRFVVVA